MEVELADRKNDKFIIDAEKRLQFIRQVTPQKRLQMLIRYWLLKTSFDQNGYIFIRIEDLIRRCKMLYGSILFSQLPSDGASVRHTRVGMRGIISSLESNTMDEIETLLAQLGRRGPKPISPPEKIAVMNSYARGISFVSFISERDTTTHFSRNCGFCSDHQSNKPDGSFTCFGLCKNSDCPDVIERSRLINLKYLSGYLERINQQPETNSKICKVISLRKLTVGEKKYFIPGIWEVIASFLISDKRQ
jgi:hypothetical protein